MTISVTYEETNDQLKENNLIHRPSKINFEENINSDENNLESNLYDNYKNFNYDEERKRIIDDNNSSHDGLIKTYYNFKINLIKIIN
jgi:hypothetical protein